MKTKTILIQCGCGKLIEAINVTCDQCRDKDNGNRTKPKTTKKRVRVNEKRRVIENYDKLADFIENSEG